MKKNKPNESGQTKKSAEKNADFFLNNYEEYRDNVNSLDSYAAMSLALSEELGSVNYLLDIGNGGVFDYKTSSINKIVGLDLFLDKLPGGAQIPKNVEMIQGSALNIPANLNGFDTVVMVMLIHHLVGTSVFDCIENIKRAISEAYRVLSPGGKLVIMESCVPEWFYKFEKVVYKPASFLIEKLINHPPTLQYPSAFLVSLIDEAGFENISSNNIPLGKYILQFGIKCPTWVTPVQPVLFSAIKPR